MVNNFSRSTSFNRRALNVETPRLLSITSPRALNVLSPKPLGFASPRVVHQRFGWTSRLFPVLILIGAIISFFLILGRGYVYVLPSLNGVSKFNDTSNACEILDGSWIRDDNYPLYNASECPFAEQGFNCLGNGRQDKDYLKWRWKPKNCDLPRFNVHNVLEMLRDKRIVFVGDSMSRTQWESLICLLMSGVEDKKSVYEVNGNKITKRIRHAPKRVRSTLKLDKLDDISNEWINADVLIFNSGQWWVPGKLFETGCYFQVGNTVKLGMSIPAAFRMALETWASWVDDMIDTNRTLVFFRTFEPSHWSKNSRRFCNVTQLPLSETEGRDQSTFSEAIFEVIKNMTVPITVLHVTAMSSFRRDAHVGRWSDNPSIPDCSHWCLPGVPDVWNEIFLSYLLEAYKLPAVRLE
ncbi:hypothetical protein COLO4_14023 [Corchorus olitorius]|uniref:Uncharacterized protein n=1 Tax=Corchorus olitorius TaxID=93759 RepID=A0A1R3JUB9_9ROSI|nr:hypothetical protein COLO4_14023 [Corchorus olitorius]